MIESNDVIKVEVKDDWIEQGLDYALKSWPYTFNRMGSANPYSRIEKIMLGIMAEYAIVDYLNKNEIKYDELGKTYWYQKDIYDVGIGNYKIDVKSCYLKPEKVDGKTIEEFRNNNFEWLLGCTGLVPQDQMSRKLDRGEKIYIFPFITGRTDAKESQAKGSIIHAFWGYEWLKKAEHKDDESLGKLTFKFNKGGDDYKSEENKELEIEIYGTSEPKSFANETISIKPNEKITTEQDYHQVFSIRLLKNDIQFNFGNLVITSESGLEESIGGHYRFNTERHDGDLILCNNDWMDVYLYDGFVYIPGYIKEKEFRVKGKEYPRFSKDIRQYSDTLVDNWGVDIKELNPMSNLRDVEND